MTTWFLRRQNLGKSISLVLLKELSLQPKFENRSSSIGDNTNIYQNLVTSWLLQHNPPGGRVFPEISLNMLLAVRGWWLWRRHIWRNQYLSKSLDHVAKSHEHVVDIIINWNTPTKKSYKVSVIFVWGWKIQNRSRNWGREGLKTGTGQGIIKWRKMVINWGRDNKAGQLNYKPGPGLQILAQHQSPEVAVHSCYAKRSSEKFYKIHRKTPALDSLLW